MCTSIASRVPRVSVLLPVRDAAGTLEECLDSVFAQTLTAFELVVVDDGSRDASFELLARRALGEPRMRVLRSPPRGLVAALNQGLREVRAPLVARMDADDVMEPSRLAAQVEYLARHADVDLVACRVRALSSRALAAGTREYLRWQNACLDPVTLRDALYVESPLAHPSVTFRREAVLRAGGYREGDFPEDYELWLRLARAGCRMAKLPEVLLAWRQSEESLSRRDPRYRREAFDRLRAEHLAADPRLHAGRALVMWGAGRRTRQRCRLLIERGLRPRAFVDIDPRKIGKALDGAPVVPPEALASPSAERPFVLVYVTNHGARELIAGRLETMGYRAGDDYLMVG